MGFLEDFRNALDTYDGEYVDVKFAAYQFLGTGNNVNEGEWFRFQVQVFNNGHIDMKNVNVQIQGTEYAKVSLYFGNPVSYVYVPFGNIDAHHSAQSSQWVYGKAIKKTNGQRLDVVTGRIASWDASLEHLLKDHTYWGPREGRLSLIIAPD